jgi:asparagine synthase (glutamine-hydrolysing)
LFDQPYLPDSILWRQKEQFSDGVGYSWIDGFVNPFYYNYGLFLTERNVRIKEHASQVVSDEDFAKREERWSFDVPDTKEAYLFRDIFDGKQAIVFSTCDATSFQ